MGRRGRILERHRSGIVAKARSGAQANSAKAPWPNGYRSAKTRSPGAKRVTPAPTASTTPATSSPRRWFRGARIPRKSRTKAGRGSMPSQSARLMDAARPRQPRRLRPGSGRSRPAVRRRPGGHRRSRIAAFMVGMEGYGPGG
jgi:hypothetical protein